MRCVFSSQVRHFEEFAKFARSKGFQVYIVDVKADAQTCFSRNTHNRTLKDIENVSWLCGLKDCFQICFTNVLLHTLVCLMLFINTAIIIFHELVDVILLYSGHPMHDRISGL